MGLFDQFPYTNFHELNLDWILRALKELEHTIDQFVSINALKYADPIQWNITSQYEKNTIIIDPQSGTAYISVQPVPAGVALTNTDYWTVVFDLEQFVTKANNNFTVRVEELTTVNATFPTPINGWVIWGGVLYKALTNITAGDQYIVDSNIQKFTMEDIIGHPEDLNTLAKYNLVAAINEVLTSLSNVAGDLADLDTTDKSNLVAAINEVLTSLGNVAGDLADLDTTDKSNLVAAINEVSNSILGKLPLITPEEFGAVGDGVADDSAALISAFNKAVETNGTVFLSKNYLISDTIESELFDVIGSGTIIYNGNNAALRLGGDTPATDKEVTLNVISSDPFNPKANSIGLDIINCSGCIFNIYVNGFYYGVICHGLNTGWQNNIMNISYIYNCVQCLTLRPEGTGWVNNNTFIGGKLGAATAFSGSDLIGICINDLHVSRFVNANRFINQNVEGCNKGIVLYSARQNEFLGTRFEAVTDPIVYENNLAYLNIFKPNYYQGADTFGLENVYDRVIDGFKYNLNIPLTGGATNATYYSAPFICGPTKLPYTQGPVINGDKIRLTSGYIGVHLNIASKFLVIDCDSTDNYICLIAAYNGNTNISEASFAIYDTLNFGYVGTTGTTSINNITFMNSSASAGKRIIMLPDNTDNIVVLIGPQNASTPLELSNISFLSPSPIGLVAHGNRTAGVLPSVPTSAGNAGDVILSAQPTATVKGWLYDGSAWITI